MGHILENDTAAWHTAEKEPRLTDCHQCGAPAHLRHFDTCPDAQRPAVEMVVFCPCPDTTAEKMAEIFSAAGLEVISLGASPGDRWRIVAVTDAGGLLVASMIYHAARSAGAEVAVDDVVAVPRWAAEALR